MQHGLERVIGLDKHEIMDSSVIADMESMNGLFRGIRMRMRRMD